MKTQFFDALAVPARSLGVLSCLCAIHVSGCGNSNTGPTRSDEPLAPTPHVAGDPRPRTLPRPGSGAMEVEAVEIVAEVTAINPGARTITLKLPDGKSQTIKVAKEMRDLDQIKVGDSVGARVVEETALFVRRDGEPPSVEEADVLGVRMRGGPPAAFESEALQVTARVIAVDAPAQKVKLRFSDGREATINVHNAIDLRAVKPGDDLVARISERLMVEVVKRP
jgi:hypothetical protein